MKGWIIAIIIVVLLIIIGFLQTAGYLNFKWEWLTILFAALAAPFKLITGMFNKPSDDIVEITRQHEYVRQRENRYREKLEAEVNRRMQTISLMQKDIEVIDARLETLETRKAAVGIQVKNMTSEQKKEKFKELFGD